MAGIAAETHGQMGRGDVPKGESVAALFGVRGQLRCLFGGRCGFVAGWSIAGSQAARLAVWHTAAWLAFA